MTSTVSPVQAPSAERDALITGDAVLLDLRTASFATRMLSAVIDGVIQLVLLVGGSIAMAWTAEWADLDDGLVVAGVLVASVTAYVGYPVLCELLLRGRSVGRLVMGTRVVRDDGGPVHVRQSLLRAVMAMLEIWSTSGAIADLFGHRPKIPPGGRPAGRDHGDPGADARSGPQRAAVPEALQDWVRGADVGGSCSR